LWGAYGNLEKGDKIKMIQRYSYLRAYKGIPGPVLQGQVNNSNDRLEEREHTYFGSIGVTSIFNLSILYKNNELLYIEPNNKHQNISEFILNDVVVNLICIFDIWNIKNEILFSYSESQLEGDMLDFVKGDKVNRSIFASAYRLEKDFLINKNILKFNLTGRYDNGLFRDSNSALTGNFGIIFKPQNIPLSFRTNISHNFRFPNFNEMYYRNYGTRDLKPESSNNLNIGCEYNLFGKVNICLDAFYLDISDMIVAVPTSPISWSARNIARAECIGGEVSAILFNDIKINKIFSLSSITISYTLQQNLDKSAGTNTYNKQLTYIPQEVGNVFVAFKLYDFVFGGKLEYSSHRYYQADNSINSLLPSYSIADIFVKAPSIEVYKNCKLNLRFDIKNIFDTQYFIINNYIMPSRQFRLSLGMEY
jgi:outer membrane cobalamin receptor